MKPLQKNSIYKEIRGVWVFHFRDSYSNGPTKILIRTKREPSKYDGFEFKKEGKLIVHSQIDYGGEDEVYEHILFLGKWNILNDSIVQIDYIENTLEIRQKFRFYKNGAKFELEKLSSVLISQ